MEFYGQTSKFKSDSNPKINREASYKIFQALVNKGFIKESGERTHTFPDGKSIDIQSNPVYKALPEEYKNEDVFQHVITVLTPT